jgi:uncharacterized protein RhaS with RHS repeats
MYSPELGRFTSKDPIGFAGGDLNLYRYVGNNPILLSDPQGKCPLLIALGVVAAAAVYEAAFDATTFLLAFYSSNSLEQALQTVSQDSPFLSSNGTSSVSTVLPEGLAATIQVLANPDTMNAVMQLQNQQNKIDQAIGEDTDHPGQDTDNSDEDSDDSSSSDSSGDSGS